MSRKNTIIAISAIFLAFTLFMGIRFIIHANSHGVRVEVERRASPEEIMTPGNNSSQEKSGLAEGEKVNINTAGKEELEKLPGIGPSLADAICTYRRTHGAFVSAEEISGVPGIGEALFEEIRDYIVIEGG